MKPTKFMPNNQASRGKATRIPEAVWNKYRVQIIAQYRLARNSLVQTTQWIESLNDPEFRPNERQVRYHLDRWRNEDSNAASVAPSVPESTLSPPNVHASIADSSSSPGSESLGTAQSHTSPSGSSDTALTEPDSVSSSSRIRSAVKQLKSKVSIGSIREHVASESRKRPRKTSRSPFPTFLKIEHRSILSPPSHGGRSSASTPAPDNDAFEPANSASYMGVQPDRLKMTLRKIGIPIRTAQMDELLSGTFSTPPFSDRQRHEIEEAAHFFGVLQIDAHAFALYYILWLLHVDAPATSERRLRLLRSCAMAARSPGDLKFIQDLLQHELDRVSKLGSNDVELFLLRITLSFVSRTIRDDDGNVDEHAISREALLELKHLTRKLTTGIDNPQEMMVLDLSSYYVIDFALRTLNADAEESSSANRVGMMRLYNPKITSQLLSTEFLRQWSISSDSSSSSLKSRCIRNCIEWCRRVLTAWNWVVELPWELMVASHHLKMEASNLIGLYWLLWTQWQKDYETADETFFWNAEVERELGITCSELLFEMAHLALRIIPKPEKQSLASRIFDKDHFACLRRASDGFERLLKMTDAQLAETLLAQVVHPAHSDTWPMNEQLKIWSFRVFNTTVQKQPPPKSIASINSNSHTSAFKWPGYDPTMRSSDTGSTISSMRRHKDKVARLSTVTDRSLERTVIAGPGLDRIAEVPPEVPASSALMGTTAVD